MLECQLEKLFTEANLQKTTKESSYYSPVTSTRQSFLYIFRNCRYYQVVHLIQLRKF